MIKIALIRDGMTLFERGASLSDVKSFFKGSDNGLSEVSVTLSAGDFALLDLGLTLAPDEEDD